MKHESGLLDSHTVPRVGVSLALLAFATLLVCASPTARAAVDASRHTQTIVDVIQQVAANESLYQSVEVLIDKSYEVTLFDRPFPPHATRSSHQLIRQIHQGSWRYDKVESQYESTEGDKGGGTLVVGFDGNTRRLLRESEHSRQSGTDRYGNLESGATNAKGTSYRPHLLLKDTCKEMESLAALLSGTTCPAYAEIRPTYIGEEQIGELRCAKIRLEVSTPAAPEEFDLWEIWLAIDRNWIPARFVGFAANYSLEIPLEEGEVEEWDEVETGVWYPRRIHRVVNYEIAAHQGEKTVANTSTIEVKQISLRPQYDISHFQDIPFPDGTTVAVINDGSIVKTYKEGVGIDAPTAETQKAPLVYLAVVNGILLLCAGGYWSVRRRRQPKSLPAVK